MIADRIAAPFTGDGPGGIAWLRGMLAGLRAQSDRDPGRFRLLHELIWAACTDPELDELITRWHATITAHLRAAHQAGEIRAGLDPAAVAALVMNLAMGMVLRPAQLTG